MNKKQVRALRYRSNRLAKRELVEANRPARFIAEKAKFHIDMVDEAELKAIAKSAPDALCADCGKKILKKDFKAKNFVALRANRSGSLYFVHAPHFYADEKRTPLPEMPEALGTVFGKIFKIEFADFSEFFKEDKQSS